MPINQSINLPGRIEIDQSAMAVEEEAAGSAAGSSLLGEGAGEAMPPLSPRALAAIRCVLLLHARLFNCVAYVTNGVSVRF
jgi:hypothetical protein